MSVPPPVPPMPGFSVFWGIFGRFVERLLAEFAHANVVLVIKDGKLQQVRVDRSYLPAQLPRV